MRRFVCASIPAPGQRVMLTVDVSHHLLQVTRVPRGQEVELFDGLGSTARSVLVGVEGGCAVLEVKDVVHQVSGTHSLRLFAAVTKGPRFEDALRMAVELGVTEIVPVLAARSIAKGDRRARWHRVVDGAARQSHRSARPELSALVRFKDAIVQPVEGLRWVCVPGARPVQGTLGPASVMVGPEGGWTETEMIQAAEAGWLAAGLGPHVLRAETAVAAALTRVRCAGAALG